MHPSVSVPARQKWALSKPHLCRTALHYGRFADSAKIIASVETGNNLPILSCPDVAGLGKSGPIAPRLIVDRGRVSGRDSRAGIKARNVNNFYPPRGPRDCPKTADCWL